MKKTQRLSWKDSSVKWTVIEDLQKRIEELERRVAELEKRPYYAPIPSYPPWNPLPNPPWIPPQPPQPYKVTW